MKIINIETIVYEHQFLSSVFVKVESEDGLSGIGEAWWGLNVSPVVSAINDTLAPLLKGEDSLKINYLWDKMYRYAYRYGTEGILLTGLSGIDIALWDLLGKRLEVPVASLMGGTVRDSLQAYASLPPLGQEDVLVREVKRAVNQGYAGVKLHEKEVEMVSAAREAVPEGFPIMLDVNGRWTVLEALDMAQRLKPYKLVWLEEPVWPMQDYRAMEELHLRSGISIAAGENEYKLESFTNLMQCQGLDWVQPEITKIGGLTMAVKISALADLYNAVICPHGFRVGPAFYANVHWSLSQLNMGWLEIPFLPEEYSFPANVSLPKIENGKVYLPTGNGLGMPWSE